MLKTIPGSPYFRYHSENLLPADVVIVDEASMVDLALMSKLISSIPMTARLILMGDRDQLASVEAGSVLGDICSGMQMFSREYAKTIEEIAGEKLEHEIETSIKTYEKGQGLSDCIVVLKKSLRFTGKSKIKELSQTVNKGDWKPISAIIKSNEGRGVKWEAPGSLGEKHSILAEKIIDGYSDYLIAQDPYTA
jgi:exodeoxyribonuclease V alpha subunit